MSNEQPEGTRTTEQPTPDRNVMIQPEHNDDSQITSDDLEQLGMSYTAVQAKTQAEETARIAKEFQALERITAKYEAKLKAATQQGGGFDPKMLQSEMQHILQNSDDTQVEQQIEQFKRKHGSAITKILDTAKIDRAAVQRELLNTVKVPPHARQKKRQTNGDVPAEPDGLDLTWYTDPEDLPAQPPATTRSFVAKIPPYPLSWRVGDRTTVTPTNGNVYSSHNVYYGSSQNIAMVGTPFYVPGHVRRVRIDATINAPYCYTVVGASLGYASAEVILNLKVLDGSRLVSNSRLSVVRTIAVVFWVSSNSAGGRYWLSCEFDHAFGMARTYSAHVEVETWAGGFGVFGAATAYGNAYGEQFGITLA